MIVHEPKEDEVDLSEMIGDMSRLKRDFDLKWEVLIKYVSKEKAVEKVGSSSDVGKNT